MNRTILFGVAALVLFALGGAAANTHIARGVIFPVTAYEADVNKDTRVNIADLGLVASKYGQIAPTATLVPSPTPNPFRTLILADGVSAPANTGPNWFGSYQPANCPEAVVYVQARTLDSFSPAPSFDLLLASSPGAIFASKNSLWQGMGLWITHRIFSTNQSGVGPNNEFGEYPDNGYGNVLVGVLSNNDGIYRAEVHCSSIYTP